MWFRSPREEGWQRIRERKTNVGTGKGYDADALRFLSIWN